MKERRRARCVTQAAIARVLRAYSRQGFKVRVILMTDGSTKFEPVQNGSRDPIDTPSLEAAEEIIL
jgi:hypothetical protein